jgi:hypothetical protein
MMQIRAELSEKWAWISGMFNLFFLILFLGSVITFANSCKWNHLKTQVRISGPAPQPPRQNPKGFLITVAYHSTFSSGSHGSHLDHTNLDKSIWQQPFQTTSQ